MLQFRHERILNKNAGSLRLTLYENAAPGQEAVLANNFQVAYKGSLLLPGTLFQGPGPGWVDKCVPNFTPLTNNIQACGWLLLKGQALASPRSATTKRDPRSQMGPW